MEVVIGGDVIALLFYCWVLSNIYNTYRKVRRNLQEIGPWKSEKPKLA